MNKHLTKILSSFRLHWRMIKTQGGSCCLVVNESLGYLDCILRMFTGKVAFYQDIYNISIIIYQYQRYWNEFLWHKNTVYSKSRAACLSLKVGLEYFVTTTTSKFSGTLVKSPKKCSVFSKVSLVTFYYIKILCWNYKIVEWHFFTLIYLICYWFMFIVWFEVDFALL